VVLIDMNTQRDFLSVSGSSTITNRSEAAANVARLIAFAKRGETFVVSSLNVARPLASRADRSIHEPHVDKDSKASEKITSSLLPRRLTLGDDDPVSLPVDLLANHRQVIFPKWGDDLWTNPRADRVISSLRAKTITVFGVGVEYSIRLMVLGLRTRGYRVRVVTDASGGWNRESSDLAMRVMQAKGAELLTTDQFLANYDSAKPRTKGRSSMGASRSSRTKGRVGRQSKTTKVRQRA
jgi:nicotinamidase-related amidase